MKSISLSFVQKFIFPYFFCFFILFSSSSLHFMDYYPADTSMSTTSSQEPTGKTNHHINHKIKMNKILVEAIPDEHYDHHHHEQEKFSDETGHYGSKKYMKQAIELSLRELGAKKSIHNDDDVLYYFSLHDYDRDAHLDGHELRIAFCEHDSEGNRMTLTDIEVLIDATLDEDDTDNDGKISWEEYLASLRYHEKVVSH